MDGVIFPQLLTEVQRVMAQHQMHLYIGVGTIGAAAFAVGLRSRQRQPLPDGWGSARFAEKAVIKDAGLFRRDGVVVGYAHGRHLRIGRDKHVLVVGPSRSGKSILLLKTLKTYQDSVICLDLKGTLSTETARIRAQYGPVYSFDPVHGGDHLNPWDLIRWGHGQEVVDIQRVVGHLTYTEADTRSDAGLYYLAEAQESLWATIPYLYYSHVEEASMGGLRKFYSVSGPEIRTRIRAMQAFGQPSPHPVIHDWAGQVVDKSMDLLDKIWSAARRWLAPWVDPTLAWNTHDTTIDLQAFQQLPTPATLYLKIGVEDIQDRLRPFTRMLLDLLSLRLCDRPEHDYQYDVLWVLDDMAELRRLDMVTRLTAYLGGFGHFLLGGSQSFAQIWEWYGKQTALLNNSQVWVLFRPMDPAEARVMEQKLGETTIIEVTDRMTSGGWHRRSRSIGTQSHRRPLMTADELQRLRDEQLLVCVGGYPPMLIERGPMEIV